ncbi:glycoside hydrolase family 97 protein [Planctobacterium marinum]|uniref:Alpha-glucosidase n=1 Tax=Planctobacterium marinum TaxID=1631968 RepID=A0AA48KQP5_9ALTE|nr:alpha-glucosidase [Planctobacterium marinum]
MPNHSSLFTKPGSLLVFTSLLLPIAHSQAETLQVQSPDSRITVLLSDDGDVPGYSVKFDNETILNNSRLGLVFKQLPAFGAGFDIQSSQTQSVNQTWEQPWGERQFITDQHNELSVVFKNEQDYQFTVRFRVFNDGLGFRYEVNPHKNIEQVDIVDEETEFALASDATAWWIPARGWNRYEYIYETTPVSAIDRVHTPFTVRLPTGTHVSIHEAALVDYAAFTLDKGRDNTLKTDLTPWCDGIRVKTAAPFKSSWRTIQIADDATGLLNSDLILNLNEPNKLGDVSWVEPGKYVGIWWAMHVNEKTWGSGEKHGATTEETKRYIDFAAKYGFDGVLVEGWNEGWDGSWFHNGDVFSFTKSYPDFDLPALAQYARDKGVRLVGHHETSGSVTNYRNQMADAFDLYEKMGIRQVKTGYVADGGDIKRIDANGIVRHEWHDGQFMANEYLHSVLEAAQRKISINTHEPIKDTGLRRTYPNWITREGARGQEFNAWGSPPNPPEHTAVLPYTRMLSGPMDFTPGIFNLAPYGLHAENRVQTTLAKQLALYVVLYSPIQMAADLPRHYENNLPAFQFIRDVPADWQQSIALAGEVGDYVVFARKERDGDDWYLGGLTDENPRVVEIKTDFLDADRVYDMQVYQDGAKADWRDHPYEMSIFRKPVRKGESLSLRMATSGGVAIRFKLQK